MKNIITVDIGNSNIKSIEFSNDLIINKINWSDLKELKYFLNNKKQHIIICSVVHTIDDLKKVFDNDNYFYFSHDSKLPIKINYDNIYNLGLDRIATSSGKYFLKANNCLIIDIGTCITYNILTSGGIFNGGAISLGLSLRKKAIQTIDKLKNNLENNCCNFVPDFPAQNTRDSLTIGIIQSMIFEINEYIKMTKSKFDNLEIVLTGGDAIIFYNKLAFECTLNLNLLMYGLKEIYKLNHEN